jgi:predicted PhzF superfamily epimerase YddE/YHI9
MGITYYHIDSFSQKVFAGNPAGVCVLEKWLDKSTLLNIARENGLAETAFIIKDNDDYQIRWFTPDIEMDLCGHATLAAAHVVSKYLEQTDTVKFRSATDEIDISIKNGLISMVLPKRVPIPCTPPQILLDSVSIKPVNVLKSRDYIFVYKNEDDVKDIEINPVIFNKINLDPGGLCVTAVSSTVDFVSRYFTPQSTILEDPVTGSAHCSLIPYWASILKTDVLKARQLSRRQGDLYCENRANGVIVSGYAVTYKIGEIIIE